MADGTSAAMLATLAAVPEEPDEEPPPPPVLLLLLLEPHPARAAIETVVARAAPKRSPRIVFTALQGRPTGVRDGGANHGDPWAPRARARRTRRPTPGLAAALSGRGGS